jgi:tetratricopeptide (TPR) repeat protein
MRGKGWVCLLGKSWNHQTAVNWNLSKRGLHLDRYVPYILNGLAELYGRTGNGEAQIAHLERMVDEYQEVLDTDAIFYKDVFPTALNFLGDLYYFSGDTEKAREYYEIYLQYYSDAAGAIGVRANLGQLFLCRAFFN